MEILNRSLNSIKGLGTSLINSTTANPLLYGFLAMFLTMYGPRLHPRLPPMIRDLFNNNIFRFVVILLVIYMSNNNLQMSLIIAIGFLLVISIATSLDVDEHFAKTKEGYSDFDAINEFYEEEFTGSAEDKNAQEAEAAAARVKLAKAELAQKELAVQNSSESKNAVTKDNDEDDDDDDEDDENDAVQKGIKSATKAIASAMGTGTDGVEGMVNKIAGYVNNSSVESFDNYAPF